MVQVRNETPGLICIDVPCEQQLEEQVDPVARVLASVDVTRDVSPADALRTLVALELAKRQAADAERQLLASSLKRAKDTVDLYPAYQGEGKPPLVNDVPDDKWRRVERIPSVAARIAAGQLRVVGYPETGVQF